MAQKENTKPIKYHKRGPYQHNLMAVRNYFTFAKLVANSYEFVPFNLYVFVWSAYAPVTAMFSYG